MSPRSFPDRLQPIIKQLKRYTYPCCSDVETGFLQAVRCVALGGFHTVAVTDAGVAAWGCNDAGQLGTGDVSDRRQPAAVPALAGRSITAVACGASHTLFLCK